MEGELVDVPTLEARIDRLHVAETDETVALIEYLGGAIARLNQLSAEAEPSWLSDRLQQARAVLLSEVHLRGALQGNGPVLRRPVPEGR